MCPLGPLGPIAYRPQIHHRPPDQHMAHFLNADNCLVDWLSRQDQPDYRVRQIEDWIYRRRATTFGQMTNLPQSLQQRLADVFDIWTTRAVRHHRADDGSEKLVLELSDGGRIECVLLRDEKRRTICVSTQVGCAMGCVFCASGLNGVERNLTTGEIVEQMLRLQRLLPEQERLSHVVIMGMGEPLANLPALLPALEAASDCQRLGISKRRITISTVGLPRAIDRLVAQGTTYHLAVSLHAANDQLRNRLVPTNERTGLPAILAAADRYFESSGRRLTFEYVLLADINDSDREAHELAGLLRGRPALLNIIPYNPVAGLPYRTPSRPTLTRFRNILEQHGIQVQVRQRKGDKINAACGQLRRETPPQERQTPPAGSNPDLAS